MEHQEMVLTREEDLDAIGIAEDDLEAAFQAFWIRRGRVMGRKGWVVDRVEELDTGQLVSSFIEQLYMEREEVPPRILVPVMPDDTDVLEEWLSQRRGSRVRLAGACYGAPRAAGRGPRAAPSGAWPRPCGRTPARRSSGTS